MEETQSDPSLIDNLMLTFGKEFYANLSPSLKERIFKESLANRLRILVNCLSCHYPDVRFYFRWYVGGQADFFKDDQLFLRNFDHDIADDDESWEDDPSDSEHIERLYDHDISQIHLGLFFQWTRVCNIGHRHRTTRYYYYSMPKITELLAAWLLNPDHKEFVKMYVPNFFY